MRDTEQHASHLLRASTMKTGALAFIDALGFKGIWKRTDAEELLNKLKAMYQDVTTDVRNWNDIPGPVGLPDLLGDVHVTFLSDTIVMAVEAGTEPDDAYTPAGRALRTLTGQVNELLRQGAITDPPLAYRGCICIGDFLIEDRFILGPAVDRAAGYEREAEGAFVWLDPGARALVESDQAFQQNPGSTKLAALHRYPVPIKNGQVFDTFAVVPFTPQVAFTEWPEIAERILSTFKGSALDIVIKHDNTKRFLDASMEAFRKSPEDLDPFAGMRRK